MEQSLNKRKKFVLVLTLLALVLLAGMFFGNMLGKFAYYLLH